MQAGDITLAVAGEEIEVMRDLPRIVAQSAVGKKYKVVVWRNGSKKTLTIETDRYPDDLGLASTESDSTSKPESDDVLGAELSKMNSDVRTQFKIDDELKGVVVLSVERAGLAARNGIRAGDVITSVNNKKISEPNDVTQSILKAKKDGREKIVVLLQRNNASRFIAYYLSDE
jgi:serine protease Do